MKKRVTGLLLAFCLCLTLLPETAGAAYEQQTVSAVSVSVTAPKADADLTTSTPTVESSQPYYIADSSWTRVAADGCTANLDYWGSRSETFVGNNWYLLRVKLLLDYGYAYADSVTAEGFTADKVEVTHSGDDAVFVSAWFKVGSPMATETISSISISGVPTERRDKVGDWTDAIEKAAISENCKIAYATIYAWDSDNNCWSVCYNSDTTDSSKVYGAGLVVNTNQGHTFTDSTTVTVNGKTAEITERRADEIEVFVPFNNNNVTIGSVKVSSDTWPIEGNTIDNGKDNFSIGGEEYAGYTLESAKFQIEEGSSYRDLKDTEAKFDKSSHYRVIAVLKAKDYAVFADSVKGDFNGTGTTLKCEVSDDGKTCTVTRTCKVYDPVYTCSTDNPSSHINDVTIYRKDPAEGEAYENSKFSPDGKTNLCGAKGTYSWCEVPYVGSTSSVKNLSENDKFESGKVYLLIYELSYSGDYRFGEGFTVSFKRLDGSDSKYARMECARDTARSKQYNIWYTVGDVTQQAVTNVTIAGPESENGTLDTSDLSRFTATGGVTITSASYYYNSLSLTLKPQSGYYFGRTVTVTYNGKTASVTDYTIDSRFDVKYADVDYTAAPAIPITVTGITAKNKTYDGTTSAELDISQVVLNGVEAGHDVTLDLSGVTAVFTDQNAGTGKTVTVTGQFKLTGNDADKYALTQPTLALTADITACETFTDATDKDQTIYVGESGFVAPKCTGVTVNGVTETVIGDVAYKVGNNTKTAKEIGTALKALKAGEKLEIGYIFTTAKDGNYSGTAEGTITVTAQDRPAPGTSGSVRYDVTVAKADHGTVSASTARAAAGDTVTLTVQPDSGYVLAALTVTDSQGREAKLTDLGGGKYTFTMPGSRVEVQAAFAGITFSDVPSGAYYAEAVRWAVEKGVTTGTTATTFSPSAPCTRAQAVTFLWRAAGSPEPKSDTMPFADVAADSVYAKAILWAVEQGITLGTTESTFSPNAPCARGQIVTFLYRAAGSPAVDGAANPFTDVSAGSPFLTAILWAAKNGVTTGVTATTFAPSATCTRGQIVTFLYRTAQGM